MCGIVGALSPKYFDHSFINQMTGFILHRGPDRRGTFFDEKREIKKVRS
jgi:asparagine synthetase B (glutamine-hydrolysing)